MNTTVIAAIIGGFVSLLGIWLNHYLAIRRELLFRGLTSATGLAQTHADISARVSRKNLLKSWYSALLAIAVCPLVYLVIFRTCAAWYIGSSFAGSFFGGLNADMFSGITRDLLELGPLVYAGCIVILFPLLVFFYRRVTREYARLILAVLT